jgi:hypothetical protein
VIQDVLAAGLNGVRYNFKTIQTTLAPYCSNNMADEQIMAKGLRFFDKHPSQPDFVIGSLVITPNDIVTMCKENIAHMTEYNGQKQLKLQLKRSQAGAIYASVDTYKKGDAPSPSAIPGASAWGTPAATPAPQPVAATADDLPF